MPKSDTQFKPGQSGNPKGRPKGKRDALTESFIDELGKDFKKHGKKVIQALRSNDPAAYIRAITSLVPKVHDHDVSGGLHSTFTTVAVQTTTDWLSSFDAPGTVATPAKPRPN